MKDNWTNQKPFKVTEKQINFKWGCSPPCKLKCKLCGHIAKVGDTFRWVYANGKGGNGCGNFMVCSDCDGVDVLERGRQSFDQARKLAKQWGIYGPDWQE